MASVAIKKNLMAAHRKDLYPLDFLAEEDLDVLPNKRRKIMSSQFVSSWSTIEKEKELPMNNSLDETLSTYGQAVDGLTCEANFDAKFQCERKKPPSDSCRLNLVHTVKNSSDPQYREGLHACQMPSDSQKKMVLLDVPIEWSASGYCSPICAEDSSKGVWTPQRRSSEGAGCCDSAISSKSSSQKPKDVPVLSLDYPIESVLEGAQNTLNIHVKSKCLKLVGPVPRLQCKTSTGANKFCEAPNLDKDWKPMEGLSHECCPQAIGDYLALFSNSREHYSKGHDGSGDDRTRLSLKEKVKKHLLFLGWKIESKQDKSCLRIRLVSPTGKNYYSLHGACVGLDKHEIMDQASANYCRSAANCSVTKKVNEEFYETIDPAHNSLKELEDTQKESGMLLGQSKQETPIYPFVDIGKEYCPEAVVNYAKRKSYMKGKRKRNLELEESVVNLRSEAKMHLSFIGWRFKHEPRKGGHNLSYFSPDGKWYHSLRAACEACLQGALAGNRRLMLSQSSGFVPNHIEENENSTSWCLFQLRKLGFGKTALKGRRSRMCRKRRNYEQLGHYQLAAAVPCDTNLKRRNPSRVLIKKGDKPERGPRWVLRSSKRALQVVDGVGSSQHSARTILSWMMDSDMILPRQRVSYIHRRGEVVMAEGTVTREGIKCKCCSKVYSLAKFEVHAGSRSQYPANNIFLSDGRSIMQCQMQLVHSKEGDYKRLDLNERKKGDYSCYERDKICSVCHYGGQLLHCDSCPSSYHPCCVGVQDLQEGRWSCPSCRCTLCGQSEYDADIQGFTPSSILCCDMCKREYHVGCLRERGGRKLERCPLGNWFCGRKCSKIFAALQKHLGKSKPVGATGLSWTILRSRKEICFKNAGYETITEQHSKLWVALSVLHESFVPITEPRTKRDLVTDVLFNSWSELKRLNFQGFYTMILEKDDELISVATIRIHGEKVAEMPLVATCVPYRRQGMCRLLVNEVEKLLSHLGVERLIVPAVSQLLETWTTSFGFKKLTWSERLELLEYSFLDFQATTMCQRILLPPILTKNKHSRVNGTIVQDRSGNGETVGSECSLMSDVIQTVEPIAMMKPLPLLEFPMCIEHNASNVVGLYSEESVHEHSRTELGDALQQRLQQTGASEDGVVSDYVDRLLPDVKEKQLNNPICRFRGLHYSRRNRSSNRESARESAQESPAKRRYGVFYSQRKRNNQSKALESLE
ncbi:hypothetical protein H6P81_006395 [Aristolochia fimbriata]|uniref:Uncharacterized protein n=1 Tax=Aristolochia fimbriata TaxID=158543 RepID=A0AAV7EZZ3_ARIFI|nr:hypothetical protein H6P81_006395 [Aristolochia fimbriata]